MEIPNITDQEIADLKATRSSLEWNSVRDGIKDVRGGVYPPDWWNRIMMSGVATEIYEGWADKL